MSGINKWWGNFHFEIQGIRSWHIGERTISIKRYNHEWTIWNKTTTNEVNEPIVVDDNASEKAVDGVDYFRVMVTKTNDELTIEPSLADRAMIVRPSKPFSVLANEKIQIYVSTPVWFTVMLSDTEHPIADIPFWRPSDSWFGPSTISGDLCYSKYTDARMEKSLITKRDHRAITLVSIKNNHEETLVIERLNIPVPALKLYVDETGEFWTDQVSIIQEIEHAKPVSHLKISKPDNWEGLSAVSESRELSTKTSFLSSIRNFVA